MQDIVWVDAHSHAAYDELNDVLCFNTTYLTNQYELPFANFLGVNHHGGLLPGGILTDQAAAMHNAFTSGKTIICNVQNWLIVTGRLHYECRRYEY
ncbi:Protein FAR1-RELATED SEQUENCE 8 [Bienertia sinuspersici]